MENSEEDVYEYKSLQLLDNGKDFFESVIGGLAKIEIKSSSEDNYDDDSDIMTDSTGDYSSIDLDSSSETDGSPFVHVEFDKDSMSEDTKDDNDNMNEDDTGTDTDSKSPLLDTNEKEDIKENNITDTKDVKDIIKKIIDLL